MAASRFSRPRRVRLGELLEALSHALDMTEGQPGGHCARCGWIGTEIGRQIGLTGSELKDLYYTILLKDLGCSSNAARICQLYLADDIDFKRDFKRIDGSLPKVLRFVLAHTGVKSGLAERFRAIVEIMRNGGEIARELIETRCQRGAAIARQLRFSEGVAMGIHCLDEHWDGSGKPEGLRGADIPLFSRIALIAQVVDVFQLANGPDDTVREVAKRSAKWFDPELAAAFRTIAQRDDFWKTLAAPDLPDRLFALDPAQHYEVLDDAYLDEIVAAFAQVVDSKSPYTAGHSDRVALFADMIAEAMGLCEDDRRWLKRIALLHDIGKLGVSNSVLDKPGKLDEQEWAAMKRHAEFTELILSRVGAFESFAFVAAAHHERLDGKGYPRGLSGDAIPFETRIITTADIFDALTAERPYRAAMPISNALAIMQQEVGAAIDPDCFAALNRALANTQSVAAA
jgi:HD-GYP domain-containing protein (c-di-GMP phosphodiesterase class II)